MHPDLLQGGEADHEELAHILRRAARRRVDDDTDECIGVIQAFQRRVFATGVSEQHSCVPYFALEVGGAVDDGVIVVHDALRQLFGGHREDAIAGPVVDRHFEDVRQQALSMMPVIPRDGALAKRVELHGAFKGEPAGRIREQASHRAPDNADFYHNSRHFAIFFGTRCMVSAYGLHAEPQYFPHIREARTHGRRLLLPNEAHHLMSDLHHIAQQHGEVIDVIHQTVQVQMLV
ncbi:poly(3-hydroxyalkanoate) polymerase, putative [Babesia ovata]|uniref:Poly(3-hydroxyalkanoate) polymerase, putative n=1 Tax=Babesia ovata TaxID=189622 RepID=A0A2H6K8H1_9APIC|nr:poly(3-hydroxyalkanoate) polymerase, putative [Babesia ovata]GBE59280.1 poly(3-hydroxyalkanoate) polymerase, putative [Babesia ovata]